MQGAASGANARLSLRECVSLTERHRCAEADLVVVPDLSVLHDVDRLAADVDLAVSFLYIVSLGVDIATQTQLSVVQGVPQRIYVSSIVCGTSQRRNSG